MNNCDIYNSSNCENNNICCWNRNQNLCSVCEGQEEYMFVIVLITIILCICLLKCVYNCCCKNKKKEPLIILHNETPIPIATRIH
jgi:hypothetical protein